MLDCRAVKEFYLHYNVFKVLCGCPHRVETDFNPKQGRVGSTEIVKHVIVINRYCDRESMAPNPGSTRKKNQPALV